MTINGAKTLLTFGQMELTFGQMIHAYAYLPLSVEETYNLKGKNAK